MVYGLLCLTAAFRRKVHGAAIETAKREYVGWLSGIRNCQTRIINWSTHHPELKARRLVDMRWDELQSSDDEGASGKRFQTLQLGRLRWESQSKRNKIIQGISSISMSTYHISSVIQVWVGLSGRGLHESSFPWILPAESAKWKNLRRWTEKGSFCPTHLLKDDGKTTGATW